MLVSFNWIKNFLDLSVSSNVVAEQLISLGLEVEEIKQLKDDVVFDISVYPNRGDCLSVIGVAREIAAINKIAVDIPDFEKVQSIIDNNINIVNNSKHNCGAYYSRVIKNINLEVETPDYISSRLEKSGINTVSLVVDVLNYVMLETGQPMHAFDLDKISDDINICNTDKEESLVTIDGSKINIPKNSLIIKSGNQVEAVAGVIGGKNSAVNSKTRNLLLESAYFDSICVRKSSQSLSLQTDSSYRFERGVDFANTLYALEYASFLINQITSAEFSSISNDIYDDYIHDRVKIEFNLSFINYKLGTNLSLDEIKSSLEALGIKIDDKNVGGGCIAIVPSWRKDLSLPIDLVEEVARVIGYDNLPTNEVVLPLDFSVPNKEYKKSLIAKNCLVNQGYSETISYSFISEKIDKMLGDESLQYGLLNPISTDLAVMRTSILGGLLKSLSYNLNRQQENIKLFEIANVYHKQQDSIRHKKTIGMIACGEFWHNNWQHTNIKSDFFVFKSEIMQLLDALMVKNTSIKEFEDKVFCDGQSALILQNDKVIAKIGKIQPGVLRDFTIKTDVFAAEIFLDECEFVENIKANPISKFPIVKRDFALLLGNDIPAKNIINTLQGMPNIISAYIFDVYKGKNIDANLKSLGVEIKMQSSTKTLDESAIQDIIKEALNKLEKSFGAKLRD